MLARPKKKKKGPIILILDNRGLLRKRVMMRETKGNRQCMITCPCFDVVAPECHLSILSSSLFRIRGGSSSQYSRSRKGQVNDPVVS